MWLDQVAGESMRPGIVGYDSDVSVKGAEVGAN